MIFISSSLFVTPLMELSVAGLAEQQVGLMATFAIFIILTIFYYQILSIIAFFHYVIYDGIKHSYCHFYTLNMRLMVYILAPLHLAFFLTYIVRPGKSETSSIIVMTVYFILVLAFLILMFFWSGTLQDVLPKLDEVAQPIDEESETEIKNTKEETPKEATDEKTTPPTKVD